MNPPRLSLLLAALLMTGCASLPDAVRLEWQHVSHPLAGPPFGPTTAEDSLDQLNALAKWQQDGWYYEAGFGWKVTDGGMYGPRLMFTSRIGREIRVRGIDR